MSAKHTEDSVLGLARDFMASRVLLSAAELDLFTLLSLKPLTAEEIAAETKTRLRGISILLDALSALGLLVKKDGRYRTESSAVPLLSADALESILPMVLHMGTVWHNWSHITDIVQGKTTPEFKQRHPEQG